MSRVICIFLQGNKVQKYDIKLLESNLGSEIFDWELESLSRKLSKDGKSGTWHSG